MDVTSIASYAMYSQQASMQQNLQVAMMKQIQSSSEAALSLLDQASQVASMSTDSSRMVPTSASSGVGTVVDISV
ncbi:MAG: hypothetical protein BWY78_00332 [Alphaproteobacteria bacterium ADurb.Bin438]|nr:MAG: hypothetical protein BWY78_00332 [Alphaproteobacteria bacterium ADurb.Bin438]